VGAELAGASSPLEALVEYFGDDRWLLILDNIEQVVEAAGDLDALLARCPDVVILATSRTVLGLRAEHEYPVSPLPLPAEPATASVEALAASPAIALFVERAGAVRAGFTLTAGNVSAVAEICRRLEGLPLAIELAAARIRLLDPDALLGRLAKSLDTLGAGAVDLPERQRTLRATVEWSVGLLDDAERSLLEIAALFVDGWTVEAAAQVAEMNEDRALDLTEALARHSLIYLDPVGDGPRPRMLETIRTFVAERLAARPDAAEVERRHAHYYRALTGQADRSLRIAEQSEWLERLEAEEGNLAAAVRWYLAHDTGPLPHMFSVLWLFWFMRDRLGEARSWVAKLMPTAESFDPRARVELAWTAAATGAEVGDDQAALAARERLAPLVDAIEDPYLRAVSQLVMAWTSAIVGDFVGYRKSALVALQQLRGQDEPFWTALAVYTAGLVELTIGRYDDALSHLTELRDLADQLDNPWLAAVSRAYLGTLAIKQGKPEEARAPMDEGLELSVAAHSTRGVTLCLAAFARLSFASGDPEQAAMLAAAAEELRRRVGLQTWALLRREEADLIAQIRQALGDDQFDQLSAAGSRLSQQEAVAAIRDRNGAGTATP
jgi:predicted ATPase